MTRRTNDPIRTGRCIGCGAAFRLAGVRYIVFDCCYGCGSFADATLADFISRMFGIIPTDIPNVQRYSHVVSRCTGYLHLKTYRYAFRNIGRNRCAGQNGSAPDDVRFYLLLNRFWVLSAPIVANDSTASPNTFSLSGSALRSSSVHSPRT